MKRLLDWRALLVYVHRWLGIAGCLLFLAWFVSGIVLMYVRMPSLSAEERLARSAPVDLTQARVEPAAAARNAGFEPATLRVGMLGGRPVYRFNAGGAWATVFADSGERLPLLDANGAIEIARAFMPEHASTLRHDARLLDSDQWTLSSAIRPLMPLHRIDMGDPAGTLLYVSSLTGEPVLDATRRERVWNYVGAVTHWLYFTPLRRQTAVWVDVVVWLSIAGCVLTASGLVWGVWRLSPYGRYRLKRVPAHSPYAGMMKWHHYAGLLFGFTTCTWIFSGLMSMTPWDWSPGNGPTAAQRRSVSGAPVALEVVTIEQLRAALRAFSSQFAPRELEIAAFQGEPFATAYRPPAAGMSVTWENTDRPAFLSPTRLERQHVWLSSPDRGLFQRFDARTLERLAARAVPSATVRESVWLDQYDAYYYDRSGTRPLPVLRVRYADPSETWLYVDPFIGAVVQKEERRTRWERWLYHGLHSLDFPGFYTSRPLWDLVLIVLSAGGVVLAVTSAWPAFRRLRRHAARWRPGQPRAAGNRTGPRLRRTDGPVAGRSDLSSTH